RPDQVSVKLNISSDTSRDTKVLKPGIGPDGYETVIGLGSRVGRPAWFPYGLAVARNQDRQGWPNPAGFPHDPKHSGTVGSQCDAKKTRGRDRFPRSGLDLPCDRGLARPFAGACCRLVPPA